MRRRTCRRGDDAQVRAQLRQVRVPVGLVVDGEERLRPLARVERPGDDRVPEERAVAAAEVHGPEDGGEGRHGQARVDELEPLERELAGDGRRQPEEHVPVVVDLAVAEQHVGELLVVDQRHGRPVVGVEAVAAHEGAVGAAEGARRARVPQARRVRVRGRDLCANQPVSWVIPTKLQNSLSRSNRSRFG